MKSSTLHRSNLSRERIAVLEELMADKGKPYDSSPGVYVRSDKDRELDLLWQGFKRVSARDDRSPGFYLTVGFITGALCMFLMASLLNFNNAKENFIDLNLWAKGNIEKTPVNVAPANQANARTEKYTVRNGDTLESISVKYFGRFDLAKINEIQEINGLRNPNMLRIGQSLIIPVE